MNVQSPDSPLTTLAAGTGEWMQMDVCVCLGLSFPLMSSQLIDEKNPLQFYISYWWLTQLIYVLQIFKDLG